jgi:malonyl-CoA O-methyltransferase
VAEPPERFRLDRAQLRASFERASASYESAARLPVSVAAELLGRLTAFGFAPRVVLDLGAGTGRVTRELKRRYPRARVIALDLAPGMLREARRHQPLWRRFERVCGDALRLPLKDASVDIVFSNLMLPWCEPLETALAEVRRVLRPSGFFAFSTFGPDTLNELRASWAQADGYNHVNHFPDVHVLGDALVRSGLMEPVLDIDRIELGYPDALTLMRDLKAIGAHNVTAGRPRALVGRSRLERLQQAYEGFRRGPQLPATYEVIYGASWGAAGRPAVAVSAGVARIAPGSIGRARTRQNLFAAYRCKRG